MWQKEKYIYIRTRVVHIHCSDATWNPYDLIVMYTNRAPESHRTRCWLTETWVIAPQQRSSLFSFFDLQIAFRTKLTFTHRIDVWITSRVHNVSLMCRLTIPTPLSVLPTFMSSWHVCKRRANQGEKTLPEISKSKLPVAWWWHDMETFSTLLTLCTRNPQVTLDFPQKEAVTQNFYALLPAWFTFEQIFEQRLK